MLDFTITREKETEYFWTLQGRLAYAKRSGSSNDVWEALDDLDILSCNGSYPAVRAQAARVVARHGFVAMHALAEV